MVSGVFGLGLKILNEWRRLGDDVGEGDDGLGTGLALPSPLRLLLEFLRFGETSANGFLSERLLAIPRISV